MSRILQLEKIGIKDPKFVTVTRAFDFIMSILADNAGNVIVSVFPGKNGWFRTKEKRQLLSEMVLTNRIWMKRSCTNVLGRFSVKNIPTCA